MSGALRLEKQWSSKKSTEQLEHLHGTNSVGADAGSSDRFEFLAH